MQFIRRKITGFGCIGSFKAAFASALGKEFNPIISGGKAQLGTLLGGAGGAAPESEGEIFAAPQGEMFYCRFLPEENAVVAGGVLRDGSSMQSWNKFSEALSVVPGSVVSDLPVVSPYFDLLREDSEPLHIGEWERKASLCMRSSGVRQILRVVASKNTVTLTEAACGRPLLEVGDDVRVMDEMGIICREFEVFCKETGQKVSRVASLAALEEAAKRGFRCFHCGKAISDEQIVQSLSVCDNGVSLAHKNMWLVYSVGAALLDCGVEADKILFRHEADFSICEIFADFKGSLLMFSVSEDGLSADSIFRITTRARYFHPDYSFAVTASPVGGEAYKVIEAEGGRMSIVDDLNNLTAVIKSVSEKASRATVCELLDGMSEFTCVDVGSVVGEYFLGAPEPEAVPEAEKAPAAEAVPAAENAPAAAPAAGPDPEPAEVQAAEPAPEVHIEESEPVPEADEKPAAAAEPEAEAAPAAGIEPEPVVEVQAAEPEAEAPAEEPEAVPEPDEIPESDTESLNSSAEDINPEPVNEVPFLEPSPELLDELVAKMRDHILESDDTDAWEKTICEISALDGVSAMIVGGDGMPIVGMESIPEEEAATAEMAAAYLPELIGDVSGAADEAGLSGLHRICIAGEGGVLDVYPSAEDIYLCIHSRNSGSFAYSGSSGDDKNTSKALMALTVIDSFFDAVIVQEDVVVDATTKDCDDIAMAAVRMGASASSYLSNSGLEPWKLLLIDTESQLLAVYPMHDSANIVCILDRNAHESVWRSEIPGKLSRIQEALD